MAIHPDGRQLRPQHARAIERLKGLYENDPRYLALIIGGSVAKGTEREDSDVDVFLVTTGEEYARCRREHTITFFTLELTDYEGGYVEGKYIDLDFLRDVAERGSEPARFAFTGSWTVFSHLPEIDDLIRRIPVYPEESRQHRIESFFAQVVGWRWFGDEADRRKDPYLWAQVASEMSLFGGRLILAHNRILYPYHKWFTTYLEKAGDKPADFMDKMNAMLTAPSKETVNAFYECVIGFRDWGVSRDIWVSRFVEEREWNWRDMRPPIHDI